MEEKSGNDQVKRSTKEEISNEPEAIPEEPVPSPEAVQEKPAPSSITLSSSKDDVKAIMGTPTSIISDMWSYEYSSITFRNEGGDGWNDISNNLKISE